MSTLFFTQLCTSLPQRLPGKLHKNDAHKVVENFLRSEVFIWNGGNIQLQEKRNARCGAIGWQISGEVGHPDGAAA
jgi:hypothetical protein